MSERRSACDAASLRREDETTCSSGTCDGQACAASGIRPESVAALIAVLESTGARIAAIRFS